MNHTWFNPARATWLHAPRPRWQRMLVEAGIIVGAWGAILALCEFVL